MWRRSRAHLSEAGESYFEHLQFAVGVGLMLVGAGLACIIHGLFPGYCMKTASRTVDELTRLFRDRHTLASVLHQASGLLTFVGLVVLTLPTWVVALLVPNGVLPFALGLIALGIPAAFLWTNPQLEPVD